MGVEQLPMDTRIWAGSISAAAVFPFDIVKATELWLTDAAHQNFSSERLDKHGRWKPEYTLQVLKGVSEIPLVNAYLLLLRRWIEGRFGLTLPGHLPKGKRCIVTISHDVDEPVNPSDLAHNVFKIGWALLNGRFGALPEESSRLVRRAKHAFANRREKHWVFEDIVREEARRGFASTFFFSAIKEPMERNGYDVTYDIRSPAFKRVFRLLDGEGAEIGLHGSYRSSQRAEYFAGEIDHLQNCAGVKVLGNRQHCWKMEPDRWVSFEAMAAGGLLYDSSVAYNDIPGYRFSMALPFLPYCKRRNTVIRLLEQPVFLMDGAMFYHGSPTAAQVFEKVKSLLATLKEYEGVASIDWHVRTSFPGSQRYKIWGEGYLAVLDALASDSEVAVMRCCDVHQLYKTRFELLLKPSADRC